MSARSPCVDVCRTDAATAWCAGCGRTTNEIRAWRKLTPYQRVAVMFDLGRRLRHLRAAEADRSYPKTSGTSRLA